MSDRDILHFVSLTGESLSRLSALVEQAAALLDQRGSLRLRKSIVRELHMKLSAVRAIHTAETGDFDHPFLNAEFERMGTIKRGGTGRPALAIVAGTDMEGTHGNAA
jgi:hypothetical protein